MSDKPYECRTCGNDLRFLPGENCPSCDEPKPVAVSPADELDNLRRLVTAWADAHTDTSYGYGPRRIDADAALRQAVGR